MSSESFHPFSPYVWLQYGLNIADWHGYSLKYNSLFTLTDTSLHLAHVSSSVGNPSMEQRNTWPLVYKFVPMKNSFNF